jgi:hypothetical protein
MRGVDSGLPNAELTRFTSLACGRLTCLTGFVPPAPLDVLQHVYGPEIDAARKMLTAHDR